MSTRPSAPRGVLLAGVGAFAALVSLWLPWYTIKLPESFRDALGSIGSGGAGSGSTGSSAAGSAGAAFSGLFKGLAAALPSEITGKGWVVMSGGDVALAIAAGAALLIVVALGGGASGVRIERGVAGRLIALAGAVVAAIAVYHVISKPGAGAGSFSSIVEVKYGIAVAAAGGLLMIVGGLLTARPLRAEAIEPTLSPVVPSFEPPQAAVVPDPFAAPAPEPEERHMSDPSVTPAPEPHVSVDPFAAPEPQPEPQSYAAVDPFAEPDPEPRVVLDSEPRVAVDPFADPDPHVVLDSEPPVPVDPFASPDPEPYAPPMHEPEAPVAAPAAFAGLEPHVADAPRDTPDVLPDAEQPEVRDWSGFTTPAPAGVSEEAHQGGHDIAPEPSAPRPAGVSIPPPGWTPAT